jgi:hypothetical protein
MIILSISSQNLDKGEYEITLKSFEDMNLRQFNIIVND